MKYKPCCREDVHPIQAFSTVHLCQHLIHHAIGYTCAIVTTVLPARSALYIIILNSRLTVWVL